MDKPFVGRHEVSTSSLNFRALDVAIQLATAPFLLASTFFHPGLSGVALLLLLLPSIIRVVFGQPLARPNAANLPVAILAFVFLPLAFIMTPAPWSLTWPRLTTLAWSIALFFAVVNWPIPNQRRGPRTRFGGLTLMYLGMGFFVAVAGLLGMRSMDKLFYVPAAGFLARAMGVENGLPPNEIAGVLTLFIPFVVALIYGCGVTGRRRQLLLLIPLALVMGLTLLLTQSRTGMAATAIGTAVALAMSAPISRKWLAVGLVAAGLGAVLISLTPAGDWFVFAGANSWNSVIGPRWGIWGQAVDAIRDHSLWGMGPGVFGPLARFVYPLIAPAAGPVLEDAHNLYMQTALDFGLVGLLIFMVIAGVVVVSSVRLARGRPPRTLARLWASGALGALVAHALYSLTDAVALGTPGGVALWFLFGLVMSASFGRSRLAWSNKSRLGLAGAIVVVGVVSAMALPVNRAGQLAIHALLDPAADRVEAQADMGRLAGRNCRAHWYEGLTHDRAEDYAGRTAAWSALLGCTDAYTGYMSVLAADDAELARRAVASAPRSAAGYFWLAPILADEAPGEAIELYRQGLALAPRDGHRWLALAELLQPRDEAAALDAYLKACVNGDPGANGCLRAGGLAEAQGDIPAAIKYYRLSNWEGALEMADKLERQLATGQ